MADDTNFKQLVELMAENNRATGEIERDGRNTRRHLLEMKKMQSSALEVSQSLSTVFDNFFEAMDASALSNAEKEAERASIFEEMRDQLRDGIKVENTGGGGNDVSSKDGKSLMGKLGGLMGGAAMAAGGLLAGVGIGAAGLTYAMGQLEEMDTSKIKENVDDLLEMAESDRMTVENVAGVAATMTALGVGLAAFSVGSGAAAAIQKFTEGSDWPQDIKDNVEKLLSIADIPGMGGDAAAVTTTLTGLGVGLAAFGIGKAADGVGTAISTFASGDNFAENIKKEVETLLSIDTAGVFETAGLVATLTGLGVGLAAFSVGKGTAGVADAVTKFSGENFAADVKREVETLLSIDTSKGDLGDFVKTMGLLGAGLVAFSTGKGAAGAADALTQFTAGDNFAEDIKSEVNTLLTIGEDASMERTLAATGALTALGAGLTAFGAGKGVNALAEIGSSIVGFFTGQKSPVEQAIEVGEKADTIQAGADAFSAFADVFQRMATMGEMSFGDMDEAIEDLDQYARTLETILQGGTLTDGRNFKTDGLANLTEDVDKAVANIERVRGALQLQQGDSAVVQGADNEQGDKVVNLSAENIELRFPENAQPQANNVVAADNRSTSSNVTTNVNMSPQNRTSSTVAGPYG